MPEENLPVIQPTVSDCRNCCACCLDQESPPGYIGMMTMPEVFAVEDEDHPFYEDLQRFKNLPAEAKATLEHYVTHSIRGRPRSHTGSRPCIWLDLHSPGCRFYEHRPSICRDLEVGGEGCCTWREHYGVK